MSSTTSTLSSASATDTGISGNGGGGGGGSGPNSPLLFFVALGFGVVFTNLWIIVGVKYCFRYNQRNRARLAGEDPDGVDLAAMPQRRRRREKKLMTIDEVNDKFPLIKYKTWRANRAEQGLPTTGGIIKGASRPASLMNVRTDADDNVMSEKNEPVTPKTPTAAPDTAKPAQGSEFQNALVEHYGSPNSPTSSTNTNVHPHGATVPRRESQEADDDDDADQIRVAIPPEQLPEMGGDTCAICIDTIEEEDDIRGLTCGHAFHASCVDPWLTSRRACCPLCKADYYIPKPRPEGAQPDARRAEPAPTPFSIIAGGRHGFRRGRSRFIVPGIFFAPTNDSRGSTSQNTNRQSRRQNRAPSTQQQPQPQPQSQSDPSTQSPEVSRPEQSGWRQRIRLPNLPALSRIRAGRGTESGSQPTPENPTPSQLEAGAR